MSVSTSNSLPLPLPARVCVWPGASTASGSPSAGPTRSSDWWPSNAGRRRSTSRWTARASRSAIAGSSPPCFGRRRRDGSVCPRGPPGSGPSCSSATTSRWPSISTWLRRRGASAVDCSFVPMSGLPAGSCRSPRRGGRRGRSAFWRSASGRAIWRWFRGRGSSAGRSRSSVGCAPGVVPDAGSGSAWRRRGWRRRPSRCRRRARPSRRISNGPSTSVDSSRMPARSSTSATSTSPARRAAGPRSSGHRPTARRPPRSPAV